MSPFSFSQSLDETRRLYDTTTKEINANAEERLKVAEQRREKSNDMVVHPQAEMENIKQEHIRKQMEHQSSLDQMEVRIHEEVSKSTKGALESLETELSAVSAARDAMLSRRETEAVALEAERKRSAAQVAELQGLLVESKAAALEQGRISAIEKEEAGNYEKRLSAMKEENERVQLKVSKAGQVLEAKEKQFQSEIKRAEETMELVRMRQKKDLDEKDTRIKMLEKSCRDRDAEKIQRVANTVRC